MRPKVHIVCTQHTPSLPGPAVFVSWVKNAWECGAINWKIRLKSNWIEILSPAQIVRTRKGRSAEGSRGGKELALHCTWMAWAWHTHTGTHCHPHTHAYAAKLILQLHFRIGAERIKMKGMCWHNRSHQPAELSLGPQTPLASLCKSTARVPLPATPSHS